MTDPTSTATAGASDTDLVVAERVFTVMGSTAHVLVVVERDGEATAPDAPAAAEALLDGAQQRLVHLEQRWSRFLATSEISALNRAEGVTLAVSADTLQLVARCIHAWQATAGRFDPSVHDAMVRLGYDRSAEQLERHRGGETAGSPADGPPSHVGVGVDVGVGVGVGVGAPGCADIDIDPVRRTVRFGPGVALDPGGIGKGLAGDLLVAELLAGGAVGAMVNLGGDTVVAGRPPRDTGWQVGVAHPHGPDGSGQALCAVVGLSVGAVATSTRLERRWEHNGRTNHHLVDPATGRPLGGDVDAITVMASAGWWAEALAKACFVAGPGEAAGLLRAAGATGLLVRSDGTVEPFDGLEAYLR